MSAKKNWRQTVAEEMIAKIENGTAPWVKPWQSGPPGSRPHNGISDAAYKGINSLWLDMQGRGDPRWFTYRQALSIGAQVRGGEHATQIEYWQWEDREPALTDGGQRILGADGNPLFNVVKLERPRVFYANVFNAEQIDGLPPYEPPKRRFEPLAEAEMIVAGSGVKIIHDQDGKAFYQPATDKVFLPGKEKFPAAYEYYSTVLHELGHATGHHSRLKRDFGPFGSEKYAKEELRAEMASYMVSRELGLGHYPERHAAYIEHWLKSLREDRTLLFQAARDAGMIATWMTGPDKRLELEKAAHQRIRETEMDHTENKTEEKKTRVYIEVPFVEKDEAKAAGAKWDSQMKSWYVAEGSDMTPFEKWRANPSKALPSKERDPVVEFTDFLKINGAVLKHPPIFDGHWHRIALEGDRGQLNGSYRGFLDGRANGQFRNFKSGKTLQWISAGVPLSEELKAAAKAEAEANRAARNTEIKEAQAKAAIAAGIAWTTAAEITDSTKYPYLMNKQVGVYGIRAFEKSKHEKDHLIVPMRDINGHLHSYQSISPGGMKMFLKEGRVDGLMHVIGAESGLMVTDEKIHWGGHGPIYIAEGYSTAVTIHQVTKVPVVMAFNASNLKAVAMAVREKAHRALLVIAADNDHLLEQKPCGNVGLKCAEEAAKAADAYVVAPEFSPEEKAATLTDWNDFASARGDEDTRRALRGAVIKACKLNAKAEPEREKALSVG